MSDWSRIVNTTIAEYMRGAEQNILRNRKLLALMQSRGRISFNHGGTQMDFKVEFKRAPVQGFSDMDVLTFARRDRWKTAVLPYRGYATTDMMTKMERLKNKSTEAIIKVYDEIVPRLASDIEERFGDELYIDGNASGNTNRIHGIESFMGNGGAAAAGFIGSPSDTYAGLSTVLGNYGGDWSLSGANVNWPSGTGDEQYDFWSPLIVDYTDASWTASTKTWPNTCKEALRYGIIKGRKNRSTKGRLDLILLDNELYRQFLDSLDDEERAVITRGGNSKGLYALGFGDVLMFEGAEVTYEYGVPSNVGYGWSLDSMELCSMQSQLFVPEGPDFDIATQSWRFSIDFFGNAKFNPRNFTKWMSIT